MDIEDRLSITTPEGVTVELVLAGAGSRFVAALVDSLIMFIVWIAIVAVAAGATDIDIFDASEDDAYFVAVAIVTLAAFVIQFLYDVLFETLNGGRTPGKRAAGVRVVRAGGAPVGFISSSIRNLLRLVDMLPGMYLVGLIAIVASKRNQRLGDMAAGTVVVREKTTPVDVRATWPPLEPAPSAVDVSTVTAEDLATIRRFLERRASLGPDARERLAQDLAWRLAPKVAGASPTSNPEKFLEQVAAAKAARG